MALKFLNKKGWHTGSLRNIENVWKAEQKHEAEQKKLEELRKQIQEERERSEFRLLQEQAGLVPRQERLDFLYDSGLAVGKGNNSSSDAPFKSLQPQPQPQQPESGGPSSSSSSTAVGALFEDKPHSANDAWRKLHSDPLLSIRQGEQEALARVKNNPIQMDLIRKSVEAKKKEKDERKEHKKKHRHSHIGKTKHKKKHSEEEFSDDGHKHYKGRSDGSRYDGTDKSGKRVDETRTEKYSMDVRRDSEASRDTREKVASAARDPPPSPPRYKRRNVAVKLSEEERAARLREMQVNAELHEEQRWKRLKKAEEDDAREASKAGGYRGKSFLDAAHKSVYGASDKGGSSTIEESVRRRTHYLQGRSEAEGNAFRR
ncbi:CBF1-interacting co-repressor CIR, N-terminal domain [Dillenia turbinata]|uniref:CBF1-interacting co-repressor CIR, N-terminal domain n=1 Tax=Dillenia turbinata TaxID=194707 RepID=A0AAN8Z3T2_9MAGN